MLSISSIQNAGSTTANALGTPSIGANSIINIATSATLKYTGAANGSSDRVVRLASATGGTFTLDASGSTPFNLTGGITSAGTSGVSILILIGNGSGTESGVIANGSGTNITAVTKNGGGIWALGGGNSYTGDTTVNAGTLVVGGIVVGNTIVSGGTLVVGGTISGSTNVNTGGTLASDNGNGTLTNVNINSGGTLSPGGGGGIGTFTVNGDLNLNGSSIFSVQFDSTATAVDGITLNGNLNIASGATLNVSDIGSNPSSIFDVAAPIVTYSGAWNGGTFAGLPDDSYFMSAGQAYQISYDGGVVTLTMLAVIPEPGSAVSLLGGLGLLLGVRRRRA